MKYLHTMIRVKNLEESIHFYSELLGMKVISHEDFPEGEFTLVFLSYGDTKNDPCIELTYNYGKTDYVMGDQWGHIALGTPDIYQTCERLKNAGVKVVREPGPMKHGTTVIAFVEDPNGYKIEFIETKE
ncbi:MAG TPA: lactoylglutathione lyase [Bacteriovoracaceae bacterium]|nr:lactoylglutathione lyase [Bacteriovoracaceae bacterium]